MDMYILDGHTPVICSGPIEWAERFEPAGRRVAHTENDEVRVSTVFLGIDHAWGNSRPMLFETMVFGGDHDGDMRRYSTWDEAADGHLDVCKLIGV